MEGGAAGRGCSLSTAQRHRLVVDAGGLRLDSFIAAQLPDLSRSRVAQLVADGLVSVNGQQPRKSYRVEPGDVVDVSLPAAQASTVAPEAIPLDIIYQDADLLVLNKAAGIVVHPAPGHTSGTLVHALLHHITDLSGIGGELRPGIVHRLDRDTSGLMLVAKNDVAHRELSDALKRRAIRRSYTVAAWGHLTSDDVEVDAPIGRARSDRKRMAVVPHGRPARTRFRRSARWLAADLLEAELDTGRTHQIRVHLAHIGHPVVGDRIYGQGAERGLSGPGHRWGVELARRVPRQFLHAARLRFQHPRTGELLVFSAPLPAELEAAAEWAERTSHNR